MNPTVKRTINVFAGTSALLSLCLTAFSCTEAATETALTAPLSDIIGGHSATSTALNHTGSLLYGYDEYIEPFCTATLIAPEVVVTAKHCAEIAYWEEKLFFGIGPDAYAPDELIPIAAFDMAPNDDGGFVGMGQDVAVMYLDHAPSSNITPATPMPSSDLQTGDRMINIGYGVFTTQYNYDGLRRIGRETVAATEGLTLEALLGDFESFVEWWITGDITDEDYLEIVSDEELSYINDIYESEVLLSGDEIVAGGGANDTLSCYGDSGGPLMKYVAGSGWATFGVVSGGISSNRSVCDYGTVFATFGPEVIDFLVEAQQWEDPCGDLGTEGSCDGNVAVNCVTNLYEGTRTLDEEDCTAIGKTCVILDDGSRCGTVPSDSEDDDAESMSKEELDNAVETAIQNAFFYQR